MKNGGIRFWLGGSQAFLKAGAYLGFDDHTAFINLTF